MRSATLGSISHGSDGDSMLRAVALAPEPTPPVNLEQMEISELAVRLVPERLARRHLVVPIRLDNRTLSYGTFQPFDGEVLLSRVNAVFRRLFAVAA